MDEAATESRNHSRKSPIPMAAATESSSGFRKSPARWPQLPKVAPASESRRPRGSSYRK